MLLVADCQRISEKLLVDPAAGGSRGGLGRARCRRVAAPGCHRSRQAGADRIRPLVVSSKAAWAADVELAIDFVRMIAWDKLP